tara:strand:+ start:549 stop:1232 length:684 start_codon:yes stop_codon:yes gene_type:complete
MGIIQHLPRHIAFIMDGNGTWAKKNNLPRSKGHEMGLRAVSKLIDNILEIGIKNITLFALSYENTKRPKKELKNLFSLFIKSLNDNEERIIKNKIRINFIGDRSIFPSNLIKKINHIEKITSRYKKLNIFIAVNYGGKQDIKYAITQMRKSKVNKVNIESFLYSKDLPEVDLLIRTGGYRRLSNFLLWQISYSELYFTKVLWPNFKKRDLVKAIQWYSSIDRKFGRI